MKQTCKNWTSQLYWRQINGCKEKQFGSRKSLKGYLLTSVVPSLSSLKKIFLGFSTDGNFIFSYTFKTSCNTTGMELYAFKYKLQIWRFVPGKKIKKVASINLFPAAQVCSELYLVLSQFPNDSSLLFILGHETQKILENQDPNCSWSSTVSYFNVVSLNNYLLPSNKRCLGNLLYNHHCFMANFSIICTISADTPLFNYFAFMETNICLLNSGTHLYAFKFKNGKCLGTDDSGQKAKLFLDSTTVCLECDKTFDDLNLSASAVLDIEALLQDACENMCKIRKLTYVGFRDYETYIIDMLDAKEVLVLFGVLIEIEEGSYPFWETSFVFQWNLSTNSSPFCNENNDLFPLTPRMTCEGWERLKGIRKEINGLQGPHSKFSIPYVLTNSSVLNRQSLPFMFDLDGLLGIVL